MPNPWLARPAVGSTAELAARLERAHTGAFIDGFTARVSREVRPVVQESWKRALGLDLHPLTATAGVEFDEYDLRAYRDGHPLSLALPIIRRLILGHAADAGLIVAVGDESGRLLWVDGDKALRRQAENMLFVEGANWSEQRVGTSAPGTALALNHGIQIQRAEHFSPLVHPWSCSAVPVHDPESGLVLGVLDITGGDDAVAPQTLPLLEATAAAIEAELTIRRLSANPRRSLRRSEALVVRAPVPALHTLGRNQACLAVSSRELVLSPRHAEIVALLAWNRDGLSADRLAELLYGTRGSVVTLRAEMVRLRKAIEVLAPELAPVSRPYRIAHPIELDAHRVLALLDRGAHRVALAAYGGPMLPASNAPGIQAIRHEVSIRLREALLADAAIDTLLLYARTEEAAWDEEVWRACLRLLPARSPKRAAVVAHLELITEELSPSS